MHPLTNCLCINSGLHKRIWESTNRYVCSTHERKSHISLRSKMVNRGIEENSNDNIQAPRIPQTPLKPIALICPYTAEEQSSRNEEDNGSFVRNRDMNGVEHMSFGDLLNLANTASAFYFSRQACGANDAITWIQTTNEAVESDVSSVSNNDVTERKKRLRRSQRRKKKSVRIKKATRIVYESAASTRAKK